MDKQYLVTNLNNYISTAKEVAEKLAMLFYPVLVDIDGEQEEQYNDHLTYILNNYQSISFLVAIVNDALNGTCNLMSDLVEVSMKEGE
ncbi:MAG: hypothetical protein IJ646_08155 [Clostridia bacterium]|nr:hypothetical protein [Clostridia bacterium]